jgi:hypothetical protein
MGENASNMKQYILNNMVVSVCIHTVIIWNALSMVYAALNCHVWPVWLHNIFSHTLSDKERFSEIRTEHKIKFYIFSKHFKKCSVRGYRNVTQIFL